MFPGPQHGLGTLQTNRSGDGVGVVCWVMRRRWHDDRIGNSMSLHDAYNNPSPPCKSTCTASSTRPPSIPLLRHRSSALPHSSASCLHLPSRAFHPRSRWEVPRHWEDVLQTCHHTTLVMRTRRWRWWGLLGPGDCRMEVVAG